MDKTIQWEDKPRYWFGIPSLITKYTLYKDRLVIKTGWWSTKEDEIRLFRVMDMQVTKSIGERLWGLGSIKLISIDKTCPELIIRRIKDVDEVKYIISDLVDESKKSSKIVEVE